MQEMGNYFVLGALSFATIGALWDILTRRLPNALTYGGIASGLLFRAGFAGWEGTKEALAGGLLGGGVFLLFFLVRGMGAGDVKLMTAVGCWAGLEQAFVIVLATAIAGGMLAVGYMTYYGRVGRTLRNVGTLARFHLAAGLQPHPEINLSSARAIRMPYAVAIAAGTLYAFGAIVWGR